MAEKIERLLAKLQQMDNPGHNLVATVLRLQETFGRNSEDFSALIDQLEMLVSIENFDLTAFLERWGSVHASASRRFVEAFRFSEEQMTKEKERQYDNRGTYSAIELAYFVEILKQFRGSSEEERRSIEESVFEHYDSDQSLIPKYTGKDGEPYPTEEEIEERANSRIELLSRFRGHFKSFEEDVDKYGVGPLLDKLLESQSGDLLTLFLHRSIFPEDPEAKLLRASQDGYSLEGLVEKRKKDRKKGKPSSFWTQLVEFKKLVELSDGLISIEQVAHLVVDGKLSPKLCAKKSNKIT